MINDIMDAVTRKLYELFGDGFEIYTEPVKQGLKEPCFFIQFLEPSEKPMVGQRYSLRTDLCIQYLSGERSEVLRELNRMTGCLMDGLEYITLADGSLIRGTERSARPEPDEKMLTFFVSYHIFVLKAQKEKETMETIEIEKRMVK